jgi:uncharacterized protein (DUF983 family)
MRYTLSQSPFGKSSPMPPRSLPYLIRILKRSLRLRCPSCGHGSVYGHGLRLNETCPYCEVRYERAAGESLGAVYLTSGMMILLIFGGFWLLDVVLDTDATLFLALWILVVMGSQVVMYRLARSLWIGIAYLTGGVYADPDYEREYIAPRIHTASKRRHKE